MIEVCFKKVFSDNFFKVSAINQWQNEQQEQQKIK